MLFDPDSGQVIPEDLDTPEKLAQQDDKSSLSTMDRAAMIKAMAASKGKDWATVPADSGDVYTGPGSEPQTKNTEWEPIATTDIANLARLGVKF